MYSNKHIAFIVSTFLFSCSFVFAQVQEPKKINYTGINYDDVKISAKKVKIKNPLQITYEKKRRQVVFEPTIPQYMKTAGYWISKVDEPDKVILKKKEIKNLNAKIRDLHLGISNLKNHSGTVKRKRLKATFLNFLRTMSKRDLMDINEELILPGFFVDLYNNIEIPEKDVCDVQYAITTSYNDVRLFPTDQKVLSLNGYKDIDRLQEESLDIGTPVIVLCQTKDKLWSFVTAPTEEGWIKTANLAYTNKKTFNKWIDSKVVVVTSAKADIFLDKKKTKFLEYARMGAKLPYSSKKGKATICVKVPTRNNEGNLEIKKGYLNYIDANVGYLPYTQRNALVLAFNQINSPYGWGGSNGEQDCSGYLGQIYNCFGILLPETSVQKIKCGEVVKLKRKYDDTVKNASIIEKGVAGITFIYLSGHIMLYIGNQDSKPYIIHSIWGVTSYNDDNEIAINYINKTIVSSLEIGEEVAGNSLISRVTKFNIIK